VIYNGADAPPSLECDVCVIGSGSGGAWLARQLVLGGLRVVLLEEGGHHTRREFDLTEARAFRNLYQDGGARATDDLAIQILQGRSVGGGTTVNWCSSFRTPERVLDLWARRHGVEGLSSETLRPHFEAAEARLSIAEWPLERINRNNGVLWDGLGKLGYQRELIRRNVVRCANIGYCGMGCPIDAKQSMHVTCIPDALEKGLVLVANASARRLVVKGDSISEVEAELRDPVHDVPNGRGLSVRARTVAVCCGALNSPALLLRSGLDGGGRVGKRTFLHPVVVSLGLFDEPVEAFSGAPQSVASHHFIDRGDAKMGFFLEVPPVHPMLASTVTTGFGARHQELMSRLPYLNAMIALTVDGILDGDEGGTVGLRDDGRMSIAYPLEARNWEAFRAACKEMARIQFAAGARKVFSLHSPMVELESVEDLAKLDAAPWERHRVRVTTAHQMGGCAIGEVVDSSLRYRGLKNLFVVDGSVFPTSLGVNPQLTLFALAQWAAPKVAAAS
jgi:choline dehydrogenase-like flavoprotein